MKIVLRGLISFNIRLGFSFCLALMPLLVISGCGKSSGPQKETVSGVVNFDGVPLESGEIVFRDPNRQVQSAGGTITAGKFSVESFPATMNVEIRAFRPIPGKFLEINPGEKTPVMEQYLPSRYNDESELTETIQKGKNEFKFHLKSD